MSKRKKIFILSLVVIAVLAIAAVVCITFLLNDNDTGDTVDDKATLATTVDYGASYVNSIVFLGDFTVADLSQYAEQTGIDPTNIWTGKNNSLPLDANIDKATVTIPATGEEMLISSALSEYKPRYLVITVGVENAVPYCTKEAFCDYYGKLIAIAQKASPDTCIMLQSVFPVTRKYEMKNKEYSNQKITTCNTWINELANKYGVRYLNTAECLLSSSGTLQNDLSSDNGNTLNLKGAQTAIDYIRTHGYKPPET